MDCPAMECSTSAVQVVEDVPTEENFTLLELSLHLKPCSPAKESRMIRLNLSFCGFSFRNQDASF